MSAARPLLGPRTSRTLSLLLAAIGVLSTGGAVYLLVRAVTTRSANTLVTLTDQARLALDAGLQLVTWSGLLLLLAVAEVFRRGARQARDVDGLVGAAPRPRTHRPGRGPVG